jgi:hypothetical protein
VLVDSFLNHCCIRRTGQERSERNI